MRPPLHRSPTSRHDAHRPRGAGRFVHRSNRTRMADGIAHIVRGACSNHRSARASSHFLALSRAFSLHPAPRRHDASASITASPPHRRPREQRNHADRSSAPPDSIDACAGPSPTAPPAIPPARLKWSSNFGHCSGIGCERFETRWRQSLRSRVKATMVVKID
ncbi:hypothetical protein DO72_5926 [Burkholderia pseudomallei]|nr:hypothetical protein DO72_5926 [Burkholderia pseudomallei]